MSKQMTTLIGNKNKKKKAINEKDNNICCVPTIILIYDRQLNPLKFITDLQFHC